MKILNSLKTFLSKVTIKRILISILLALLLIIGNHFLISHRAKSNLYSSVNDVPKNKVGMLLGTGKILASGHLNLYYKYRIEAATELFHSGKIATILISGENSSKAYNEPEDMKQDLIKNGVPEDKIVLDYAGFRTLDSVVRAKEIFGQTEMTCISQPFHNERAIFIGRQKGISIIGFNAKDVSMRYGYKVQIREYLARVKMTLDLFITRKEPKFLGKKIEII